MNLKPLLWYDDLHEVIHIDAVDDEMDFTSEKKHIEIPADFDQRGNLPTDTIYAVKKAANEMFKWCDQENRAADKRSHVVTRFLNDVEKEMGLR